MPSQRLPGPWRRHDVSANGIRLHVAEAGAGPLVVLLHGFPEFWWAWRHQLPSLAARGFRTVAVDLRGYGGSDKPPRGYDLWTLAGDVSGLIGALGHSRAHVVGQGWGGWVAWTLAALHPRRVDRLVAISAPHPLALRSALVRDVRGQGVATAAYAFGFQVPRLAERALRSRGGVDRIMRAWAGAQWASTTDFAAASERYRVAMQVPGVAHAGLEYYRWAARSQLRIEGRRFADAVRRPVTAPVLQIHGRADPWVLPAGAAASARYAESAHRLELLADTGHFPHEERPGEVTDLVARFLQA